MSIHIRRATRDDAPALGRLGSLLVHQHCDFDPLRFMRIEHVEEGYAQFLLHHMDDSDALVLVAERSGAVVGYAFAAVEPESWKELRTRAGFIHDLSVDPSERRSGVASALIEAAVEWLRDQKVPRVILGTATQNVGAQALFRRAGFRPTMIEMTRELD